MEIIERNSNVSPSRQIREYLLANFILNASYSGDKLPSLDSICERVHSSKTTVQKVINSLIAEGKVFPVKGLGTFIRRETETDEIINTIVLISDDYGAGILRNYQFAIMLGANEMALEGLKYFYNILSSEDDLVAKLRKNEELLRNPKTGYLISMTGSAIENGLSELEKYNRKYVLIGNRHYPHRQTITADDEGGVSAVLNEFVAKGHKRLAFVGFGKNASTSASREKAFVKGCRDLGLQISPEWVLSDGMNVAIDKEKVLGKFVQKLKKNSVTGLISAHPPTGIYLSPLLEKHGLICGENFSHVCFEVSNNREMFSNYRLCEINYDAKELGRRGYRSLVAGKKQSPVPMQIEKLEHIVKV